MKGNPNKSLRDEGLNLLIDLIRLHPVYGSSTQNTAQQLVAKFLHQNEFDRVIFDEFLGSDFSADVDYVHVASFGSLFSEYNMTPRTNVMGIIRGSSPGPTLILNGHIDVDMVYDQAAWQHTDAWRDAKIQNNLIHGRGATDMLGGLCAQLVTAAYLAQTRHLWRGTVVVASVVDEEIGGNGTLKSLLKLQEDGILAASKDMACVIAEPTSGLACTTSLGFLHMQLKGHRPSIHMGAATKTNNALWDILAIMQALEETVLYDALKLQEPSVTEEEFALNIGIIRGGQDAAIPIGECQAEGTIFFPPSIDSDRLKKDIKRALNALQLPVELTFGEFGFNGAKFQSSSMSQALALSGARTSCKCSTCEGHLFRSPCDARLFKRFDIPTTICGPGHLKDAHGANETLHLDEWHQYVSMLTQASLSFLG